MRLTGKVMAPEAHGRRVCSDLMFSHWKRSLRAEKEKIDEVERDLEEETEKVTQVFEMKD